MSLTRKRGFYKQDINKTAWELPKTYLAPAHVGSGAYGAVWSLGFWMSSPLRLPFGASMISTW
uniref:Mitogen-activated protein kinase 13 n=2 Tax=Mus musculus TaxID=10090 RepID=A0A3B2WDA4_MOUSE